MPCSGQRSSNVGGAISVYLRPCFSDLHKERPCPCPCPCPAHAVRVELHRRQFSRVGPDPQIHPQVALHPLVPGVVVQGAPADPLLIGEALTVTEERSSVGTNCMAELPGAALHDLQDSVADQ